MGCAVVCIGANVGTGVMGCAVVCIGANVGTGANIVTGGAMVSRLLCW